MWFIIVSLIIGVVIGLLKIVPEKFMKYNSRFQQAGIILLLFSMGASIGSNEELVYNLKSIGLKAFIFAVTTCIFSVGAVYFVSTMFLRKDDIK